MISTIVLYRGDTPATARLIASTSDPKFVAAVADAILRDSEAVIHADPVLATLERGRCDALRITRTEAEIHGLTK